jgi:hypothetical protein
MFSDEGNMMKRFFYGISGIWVIISCVCLAAPEPAIVPGPGQWTVDVQYTHPQQISLKRSSDNQVDRFWYVILTLTNNTGKDVGFYPKCDLLTDTFQIIPAGKSVSPMVFERIRNRHKKRYPFLEYLGKTDNKILQGEDNIKDIAIIWHDFDLQAKNIKLFISGLSNETAGVNHPVAKDDTGKPVIIYLRKTLELSYNLQGDPDLRSSVILVPKEKRWIMR